MRAHTGRCHCGNLRVTFATEQDPAALQVRRCTCSFCTRHGALTTSDPAGAVEVEVLDPAALSRYRFGLGTCDFLLCARCGVYVAALLESDGRAYATLNVNVLDDRDAFTRAAVDVSYDGEDVERRVARRVAGWTPAALRIA